MYATTHDSEVIVSVSTASATELRKRLGAVYTQRRNALREAARERIRDETAAWDVVHDAFLAVLEYPPTDTSERALTVALDNAVRGACGRHAKRKSDDAQLRIALRKRFPV